jgi:hypothetical protein
MVDREGSMRYPSPLSDGHPVDFRRGLGAPAEGLRSPGVRVAAFSRPKNEQ